MKQNSKEQRKWWRGGADRTHLHSPSFSVTVSVPHIYKNKRQRKATSFLVLQSLQTELPQPALNCFPILVAIVAYLHVLNSHIARSGGFRRLLNNIDNIVYHRSSSLRPIGTRGWLSCEHSIYLRIIVVCSLLALDLTLVNHSDSSCSCCHLKAKRIDVYRRVNQVDKTVAGILQFLADPIGFFDLLFLLIEGVRKGCSNPLEGVTQGKSLFDIVSNIHFYYAPFFQFSGYIISYIFICVNKRKESRGKWIAAGPDRKAA